MRGVEVSIDARISLERKKQLCKDAKMKKVKLMAAVVFTFFLFEGCDRPRYRADGFSIETIPDAKVTSRAGYVSFIISNNDKSRVGSVDAQRKWTDEAGGIDDIENAYRQLELSGEIRNLRIERREKTMSCRVWYTSRTGPINAVNYLVFRLAKDKHGFAFARAAAPDYCWESVKEELMSCADSLEIE